MLLFDVSVFYTAALLIVAAFTVLAIVTMIRDYIGTGRHARNKDFFTPGRLMFTGILLASVAIFFPLFMAKMNELHLQGEIGEAYVKVARCPEHDYCWICRDIKVTHVLKALCMAFHQAIRLFAIDGEYSLAAEMFASPLIVTGYAEIFHQIYLPTIALLCVMAPVLTFTFVMTFFRTMWLTVRYRLAFFRSVHIFSDLNERTIALANSIVEKSKKDGKGLIHYLKRPLIVFTDVLRKQEEEHFDLIHSAKQIHAFCYDKDLASIRFRLGPKKKLRFYIISENEDENMRHLVDIRHNYNTESTEVYMFSDKIQSELILGVKDNIKIKIYRIYDKQALIYQNMERFGMRLFERSYRAYDFNEQTVKSLSEEPKTYSPASLPCRDTGKISVVLVGFGQYGLETLKALLWFCRMVGYRLHVTVFDKEKNIENKARRLIPYAFQKDPESQNDLLRENTDLDLTMEFHSEVDVYGHDFAQKLAELKETTYVFVSLGKDDTNIEVSTAIRNVFEKMRLDFIEKLNETYREGFHLKNVYDNLPAELMRPDIETIVYDSNISRILGVTWPIPGVLPTAEKLLRDSGKPLLAQSFATGRAKKEGAYGCRITFTADIGGFWDQLVTKEWSLVTKEWSNEEKSCSLDYADILNHYLTLNCQLIPPPKPGGGQEVPSEIHRKDWAYDLALEEDGTTVRFILTAMAPTDGDKSPWDTIRPLDLWNALIEALPACIQAKKKAYWKDGTCDGVKNHRGQPYRIHLTGDLDSYYAYDTVINSTLIHSGQVINERYNISGYHTNLEKRELYQAVDTLVESESFNAHKDKDMILVFVRNAEDKKLCHLFDCSVAEWKNGTAHRHMLDKDVCQQMDAYLENVSETGKTEKDEQKRRIVLYVHTNVMARYAEAEILPYPFEKRGETESAIAKFESDRAGKSLDELRSNFEKSEYDYFSSIAKAMHERLRLKMYYAGFFFGEDGKTLRPMLYENTNGEWTKDEVETLLAGMITYWGKRSADHTYQIGRLEHPRWNAYMISEGYTHGALRDFMAMSHHNLVATRDLPDNDIRKDA